MRRKLLVLALIFMALMLLQYGDSFAEGEPPQTDSGYVGSETCARCHANTRDTFEHTWHANILLPAEDSNILGDFSSEDPDLTFGTDQVLWVIGGQYKQRYLTQIHGQLFVLPAEWNLATGQWVPYKADSWTARPYRQYCAGCHTTGYDASTQTWIEPGVRCEACHGPGADHVSSAGNRTRIVNPADLEFQDQVEVCAQCHSRGMDPSGQFPFPVGYQPGGPAKLGEVFVLSTDEDDFWPDGSAKRHHMQYQDWQQSAHNDAVSCIFCHTSHSLGETDHQTRMVGNDRCLICHGENTILSEHIPFMASAAELVNCTDCHMPQISKIIPTDFQIRSHTFRPPNPAMSIAYGGQDQMPNACNICHADQTPQWAAAVLAQDIPSADATRVPIPTSMPVPTSFPNQSITSVGNETVTVGQDRSGPSGPINWQTGLKVLAFIVLLSAVGIFVVIRRATDGKTRS